MTTQPADPFAADSQMIRGTPGASAGRRSATAGDSWSKGRDGEIAVGAMLNDLAATESAAVLHDLCVPGTQANIDHIAITKRGVYVIDAKKYGGRIEKHVPEGLFADTQLKVAGRKQSKLVRGLQSQMEVVRSALTAAGESRRVKVRGVLCFVEGDWSWPRQAFTVDGIRILWPDKLRKILTHDGPGASQTALAYKLAKTLPPK